MKNKLGQGFLVLCLTLAAAALGCSALVDEKTGDSASGQDGTGTGTDADTGSADTGNADTGSADTGSADTGSADTGSADTGSADTGSADTGSADTGSADTGSDTELPCPCSVGDCCDGCDFLPADSVCRTAYEYQCAGAGCDMQAESRFTEQSCSGADPDCTGAITTSGWTSTPCDATASICQTDGLSYAECRPCGANSSCSAGVCECLYCGLDAQTCGAPDAPWTGWETPWSALSNDTSSALPALGERTGTGANNGGANDAEPIILVGNGPFIDVPPREWINRGGLTFDLSALPGSAHIVQATVWAYQTAVVGANPFGASMSSVVLEHVRFASLWELFPPIAIDGTSGPYTLSTDATPGLKAADVTAAVRYAVATCDSQVQFLMRFWPEETDGDGLEDRAEFASDNATADLPWLEVWYR